MSKIRDSVRRKFQATIASSTTGIVSSDPVKAGRMLVCQSIAFKNATGARGTATLQIRQGGAVYPINDQASPSANVWYNYPYPVYVNEGEQIEVSQASCSASDILHLVVIGYVELKSEVYKPAS